MKRSCEGGSMNDGFLAVEFSDDGWKPSLLDF